MKKPCKKRSKIRGGADSSVVVPPATTTGETTTGETTTGAVPPATTTGETTGSVPPATTGSVPPATTTGSVPSATSKPLTFWQSFNKLVL
jgi:hypothetical protein